MRWPFGPPHLTLKPSKKNQKRNKKTKKYKKKQTKKTKKKKQKVKKHKNTKKRAFQLSIKMFFFGGCPKIAFFDNLAQKARTPKTL